MKFAPILAGGALALVLYTLATAKAVSPPLHFETVDFRGVDTLEVHADRSVTIEIDARREPGFGYEDSTETRVQTRREGTRLVVDAKLSGYTRFNVVAPAGVHRFITDGAVMKSLQPIPEVEVLSKDGFDWEGDVGRLIVRDNSDHSRHHHEKMDEEGCNCSLTSFRVSNGRIGELRVFSPHGVLTLWKPDDIGQVNASLGARGHITLNNARRFDHIHLVAD